MPDSVVDVAAPPAVAAAARSRETAGFVAVAGIVAAAPSRGIVAIAAVTAGAVVPLAAVVAVRLLGTAGFVAAGTGVAVRFVSAAEMPGDSVGGAATVAGPLRCAARLDWWQTAHWADRGCPRRTALGFVPPADARRPDQATAACAPHARKQIQPEPDASAGRQVRRSN